MKKEKKNTSEINTNGNHNILIALRDKKKNTSKRHKLKLEHIDKTNTKKIRETQMELAQIEMTIY